MEHSPATIDIDDDLPVMAPETVALTSSQQKVANDLLLGMTVGRVCLLRAAAGRGKTTILRWLQPRLNAAMVVARQFMSLLKQRSPAALEETFMEVLERALDTSDTVLIDDLHLVIQVVTAYEYPRANLINTALSVVLAEAEARGKALLFAVDGENEPAPIRHRALVWELDDAEAEDFQVICRFYLGEATSRIDFEKVHRFAPGLTGHQLKNASLWLGMRQSEPDTASFLEYLRSQNFSSNVDLAEVTPTRWQDLKGVDDVIEELESKIALPFENDELAKALDLKPKRGVLLAGPPGTGKTSIGRALAHRLQGKFFLIDGTVNAGSGDFYQKVSDVFEEAKSNAPSVIFIDDADVIFESGNQGLYRYLLTMLDGLESASTERVCVMLTAMDATALPPALLRSGRVELWLRTQLPDEQARETILREKLRGLPEPLAQIDARLLAARSNGLSGADLKASVEEGKLLYAYAVVNGEDTVDLHRFFLRALESCFANRRQYSRRSKPAFGSAGIYGFPTH